MLEAANGEVVVEWESETFLRTTWPTLIVSSDEMDLLVSVYVAQQCGAGVPFPGLYLVANG